MTHGPGTPVGRRRVPALVGPTASGKTALSIPLAERLNAEIISMDSRQVYRGMDIGTDKVAPEDRARVRHHGLDLLEPNERYSAGRFARNAREWIREIESRGRCPLLVGGTGFFLRALTEPIFREPTLDRERRERLRSWLAMQPPGELVRWVRRLDPDRARVAEAGGEQRLSRALEVALLTGHPLSWWHRTTPQEGEPVAAEVILLTLPREEMYRRIDARVEQMFDEGLLEEVRALFHAGHRVEDPGMTGTGYREAGEVLEGRMGLDEAIDRTQRATRRYARRQLTWFRNQLPEGVLEVNAMEPTHVQVDQVVRWWEGTGGEAEG